MNSKIDLLLKQASQLSQESPGRLAGSPQLESVKEELTKTQLKRKKEIEGELKSLEGELEDLKHT